MSDGTKRQHRSAPEERREECRRQLANASPSLCIRVCRIDLKTGWCIGCLCTIGKIRHCLISMPQERQKIVPASYSGNAG